jgi:hypothetical protein
MEGTGDGLTNTKLATSRMTRGFESGVIPCLLMLPQGVLTALVTEGIAVIVRNSGTGDLVTGAGLGVKVQYG